MDLQKSIGSQIVSIPPKGQHFSNQGRNSGNSCHHRWPFPHHPWTFQMLPSSQWRIEVHDLQTYIEVMVFTLICCQNKAANATGFEQLPLKVLDDPLAHRGCHPM